MGGNVWALDEDTGVGRLGLGEKKVEGIENRQRGVGQFDQGMCART